MFGPKNVVELKEVIPTFLRVLRDDFCITVVNQVGHILTIKDTFNGYLVQRFDGKIRRVDTYQEAMNLVEQACLKA